MCELERRPLKGQRVSSPQDGRSQTWPEGRMGRQMGTQAGAVGPVWGAPRLREKGSRNH